MAKVVSPKIGFWEKLYVPEVARGLGVTLRHFVRIFASEAPEGAIEKFPVVFEIDQLRCVFCGFCVEACPCDAIRMDTGTHVRPVYDRASAIHTKDLLMTFKGIDGTQK